MNLVLPNNFTPRAYQLELFRYFDAGGSGGGPRRNGRAVAVWHRRAGKDLTLLHYLAKTAVKHPGVYWHMLPTQEQARTTIWQSHTGDRRLVEHVFPKAIVESPKEWPPGPNAAMTIVLKPSGSVIQLVGSDNIDHLVGSGPRWVTFSEFSLTRPSAWPLVRPILLENGGCATFIFTPRGRNHAYDLYKMARENPDWYCSLKNIYDTGGVLGDPEEVLARERKEGMPEELVRQEYLCDFASAVAGSYYGDLLDSLALRGQLDLDLRVEEPVFTSWDLGVSDSTAIWFWRIGDDDAVEVLDYYEASSKPLEHYFEVLAAKGYTYARHWLPHDAKARHLGYSTVVEQFVERFGAARVSVLKKSSLLDGIHAARWLLGKGEGVRFAKRCAPGVKALYEYHRAWDELRRAYAEHPYHDWSSHGSDAFRYLAQTVRTESNLKPRPSPVAKKPPPGLYPVTFDQLWEDREKGLV